MFSGIKFTAYEVFGYLFPGMVAFVATFIWWSVYCDAPVVIDLGQPAIVWIIIGVVSYLLGHVVESVAAHVYDAYWESFRWVHDLKRANLRHDCWAWRMLWTWPLIWLKMIVNWPIYEPRLDRNLGRSNAEITAELNRRAEQRVASYLGDTLREPPSRNWVFEICTNAVARNKREGTKNGEGDDRREVWSYREGFYKGMSLSVLFLSVVLLWASHCKETTVKIIDGVMYTPNTLGVWKPRTVCYIGIACFLAACFYRESAWRIRAPHIRHPVLVPPNKATTVTRRVPHICRGQQMWDLLREIENGGHEARRFHSKIIFLESN